MHAAVILGIVQGKAVEIKVQDGSIRDNDDDDDEQNREGQAAAVCRRGGGGGRRRHNQYATFHSNL